MTSTEAIAPARPIFSVITKLITNVSIDPVMRQLTAFKIDRLCASPCVKNPMAAPPLSSDGSRFTTTRSKAQLSPHWNHLTRLGEARFWVGENYGFPHSADLGVETGQYTQFWWVTGRKNASYCKESQVDPLPAKRLPALFRR